MNSSLNGWKPRRNPWAWGLYAGALAALLVSAVALFIGDHAPDASALVIPLLVVGIPAFSVWGALEELER